MELKYNGATLSSEVLALLINKAGELNVPPSYLIVKLHYEGLWGNSAVAKADNNLSGMSMPQNEWHLSQVTRPSGVVVTRGTARPKNEGGYYYRYSSLEDFFVDWLHLIRRGGSYKVADSATFAEAVKGMFRYGGAVYDYATMNIESGENRSQRRYEAYLDGMQNRRTSINDANDGALDRIDQGGIEMTITAQHVLNEASKLIGVNKYSGGHSNLISEYNSIRPLPVGYAVSSHDDWCDVFVTVVAKRAGASDLIGAECGVERHKNIFKNKGIWLGLVRPQPGDIVIFHWGGDRNGFAHHIGYVESVKGDTITTIEGNTVKSGVSTVGRNTFAWNASVIQGYARPHYGASSSTPTQQTAQAPQASTEAPRTTLGQVTVSSHAKVWETGQNIAPHAIGKTYDVIQERVTSTGQSKKAYLLADQGVVVGWLLEQDAVGFEVPRKKSVPEIAQEVIDGLWGNNPERITKLSQAGYNPEEVQMQVNAMLKADNRDATVEVVEVADQQPQADETPQPAAGQIEVDGIIYDVYLKEAN